MFGKDEFLYDRNGMRLGRKSEDLNLPGSNPEASGIPIICGNGPVQVQDQVEERTEGPAETPHGRPEKTQSSSGLLEFAEELAELERRRAKLLEQRDEFIRKLQAL